MNHLFTLVVLIFVSTPLVWLSRSFFRYPFQHGLFRYFAVQGLVVLILLNAPFWFQDPFSAPQVFSWILLILSIALATAGYLTLRMAGKPQGSFENTTRLVDTGVYRWIRHPMYASFFYLTWGALLKHPSIPALCLAIFITTHLYATTLTEEQEMVERFGGTYTSYLDRTHRFIPFMD
jgi:protein-S-isoprenylcysteine O-methyltransferase Ste14